MIYGRRDDDVGFWGNMLYLILMILIAIPFCIFSTWFTLWVLTQWGPTGVFISFMCSAITKMIADKMRGR